MPGQSYKRSGAATKRPLVTEHRPAVDSRLWGQTRGRQAKSQFDSLVWITYEAASLYWQAEHRNKQNLTILLSTMSHDSPPEPTLKNFQPTHYILSRNNLQRNFFFFFSPPNQKNQRSKRGSESCFFFFFSIFIQDNPPLDLKKNETLASLKKKKKRLPKASDYLFLPQHRIAANHNFQ